MSICLAGCASALRSSDTICREIARFANSTTDTSEHRVLLTNRWGDTSPEGEFLMYSKRCERGDYEPGKVLCAYLLYNTSAEFPEHNFDRAIRCLGDEKRQITSSPVKTYVARRALYVKPGILLRVSYPVDGEALEIAVQHGHGGGRSQTSSNRLERPRVASSLSQGGSRISR
jgi:hypothetical protein